MQPPRPFYISIVTYKDVILAHGAARAYIIYL